MKLSKLFGKKHEKNFKIGIAFGGGGTRGFAHLGAIKAFEENGIEFDEVAGTSVGSLVAVCYAFGLSSDEMLTAAKKIKVSDIKTSKLFFVPSKTEGLEYFTRQLLGDTHFEDLKKPATVVAVDLLSGKEIHITKGNVTKAIAGSCAVPMVFAPVDFGKYRLVDGGLQNNIPADVLRKNGCKYVISIDINPTRGLGTSKTSPLDVIGASIGIMMKSNAVKGYMFSDIVIKADTSKFKSSKVDGADEMYRIGYEAAMQVIPKIKELINKKEPKRFSFSGLFRRNKKEVLIEEDDNIIYE